MQMIGLQGGSTKSVYGRRKVLILIWVYDATAFLISQADPKTKSKTQRLLSTSNSHPLSDANKTFMAAEAKAKRVLDLDDISGERNFYKKRHQI